MGGGGDARGAGGAERLGGDSDGPTRARAGKRWGGADAARAGHGGSVRDSEDSDRDGAARCAALAGMQRR